MLDDNKLRKKISVFAIAPSLCASILVLLSFIYFHSQQAQAVEREKFQLAQQMVSAQTSTVSTQAGFANLARDLLAVDPLRAVSLFDRDKQPINSYGLPARMASEASDEFLFDHHVQRWHDDNTAYQLVPILPADGGPINGWIAMEMDRMPFAILHYQGLLSLLLISFLALAAVAYCAGKLKALIVVPLQQIYTGIEEYLTGNREHQILVEQDPGLQQLADSIATLAKKQQLEQEDMQSYMEQYTQELRESLETIEVQNIELDMARKNALKSSQAKSEFLANASHELRTPLSGILGFSSLLLKTDLSNQQKDYLSTIEQSAQGLLTIINDILDISRLETGRLTLEYKPVPIHQTIEEVLRMHAPSAHEKKLRLLTLVDPDVPDNLLGDPLRLKQVISNLVSNAIKFSNKGSVVIQVKFLGETDNQIHIKFCISDSGVGLTLDQQNGLFDSFSHIDTADNRVHGGTGLGLAIARGLVNRMHGDIGVESEPHCGSTFWFTARLGLNNRASSLNRHNNSLSHMRALVYDSDALSRSEITHLMNTWGADYVETDQFDDITVLASQQAQRNPVQIAIIDSQVNEELFDKTQLCGCIEKLNNDLQLPVIVLAVPGIHRMLDPILDGLQAVAISRPVSHGQLHRTICNQLGTATAVPPEQTMRQVFRSRLDTPASILAVDDNPANLRLISELLKGLGAQVETASNGSEALSICSTRGFDLILMDIQMPGMDGMETTQRLREQEGNGKRTPIVALTAHAVNEQKARLLLAGMDDYLSKPVSDIELRHVIDRWIRGGPTNATMQSALAVSEANEERAKPEMNVEEIFNVSEALQLTQHKTDLASDMFIMLLDSLGETSTKIAAARQQNDMDALQELVHKLYGGCCYCGVPALREAAGNLDTILQKKQYSRVDDATALLLERAAQLQDWAAAQDLERLWG